jgi:hypothetical protein
LAAPLGGGWPRYRLGDVGKSCVRQYVLEIEYTIVVESEDDDPENVSDNFVARLTELAPSNDHILGLSVNVLPIPELRGSSD